MINIFSRTMLCLFMSMLFVSMVGCQSEKYEVTAWKTLAITGLTYKTTMEAMGTLHTEGKISDDVARKTIAIADKFKPLYLTAVNGLEVFVKNPTDNSVDVVKNSISIVIDSLAELTEFAKTFGVDTSKTVEAQVTDDNAKNIATQLVKE